MLIYHEHFLDKEEADALLARLRESVAWKQEQGSWGAPYPRLTALYGDEGIIYTYSGVSYPCLVWTPELDRVRGRVEQTTEARFNSVLLNLYRDGRDSMGWHADDEPELGANPVVPSISLGAPRRFLLRHNRTKRRIEYTLAHGSLLIMTGTLQHFWKHQLPKTARPVGERINLTFRNIVQ